MSDNWCEIVKRYRQRHGLTQTYMAELLGVSQRTISRWERGEDRPNLVRQKALRDLAWKPPITMMDRIIASVRYCHAARALSRMPRLNLVALSQPAIEKRPSMKAWVGADLIELASGVLAEMLADGNLQKSIAKGEIACVQAATRSVLRSAEHERIGAYFTTITYFHHDGETYSDAISVPAPTGIRLGYKAIPMDCFAAPY